MVAIPSREEEDSKRPGRERATLVSQCTRIVNGMKGDLARLGVRNFNPKLKKAPTKLDAVRTPEGGPIPPNTIAKLKRDMERLWQIKEQIRQIEAELLERIEKAPEEKAHAMIVSLASVLGMGVETADMLVHEALLRNLRDRRAVARLGGLTGSPDESGSRRREKGLARAGSARLRTGMIQLAWRMVMFQKDCALVQWFMARTADGRSQTRKTMIVALARKLLIAFWRMVTTGEIPEGMIPTPTDRFMKRGFPDGIEAVI
jgi:transposase